MLSLATPIRARVLRHRRVLARAVLCVAFVLGAAAYGQPEPEPAKKPPVRKPSPSRPQRTPIRKPSVTPTSGKTPKARPKPSRTKGKVTPKKKPTTAPKKDAADDEVLPVEEDETSAPTKGDVARSILGERAPEDFDKPAEERTYSFSIKDGTYAELLDGWSRATGLGVIGDPPDGNVSFVSTEKMDYQTAFTRIQMLLFAHPKQYWLLREAEGFLVIRMTEALRKGLKIEDIYTSLTDYEKANLPDTALAMLLYTPPSGSIADLEPLRDYMPDYVRIARFSDANSMTIFGLVKDIDKYLKLIDRFGTVGDDPRDFKAIELQYVAPSQALTRLKAFVAGFQEVATVRRGRGKGGVIAEAEAWGILAYPDDENKRIIVKAVPDKITEIEKVLPWVDYERPDVKFEPAIIKIQHMPVERLVSIIKPILTGTEATKGGKSKRRRPRAPAPAADTVTSQELTILPQPATNSLIVLADEEELERVKNLVARFDVPQERLHRRVEVKNADVEDLANRVQVLMQDERTAGGAVGALTLKITPDRNANEIVLVGNAWELERAITLIEEFDIALPKATLHRARLENAKASRVADYLRDMDSQSAPTPVATSQKPTKGRRQPARRSTSRGDKFRGDDAVGLLYVFCTDREWEETYWPAIQEFDKDARPEFDMVSIPVTNGDAAALVNTITAVLSAAGMAEKVQLVPHEDEIHVINGSPAVVEEVRELVAQFDVDPEDGFERRTFELEYIDVNEVISVVQTLVLSDSSSPAPKRSSRGKKGAAPARITVQTGQVKMVPVGSSLIVWAPPKKMSEIAVLIEELDSPLEKNDLRAYEFPRGTDVRELAQQLNALFPQGAVTGARQKGKSKRATMPATGGRIQFIPQPSANKIVVSAPTALFPEIEEAMDTLRTEGDLNPVQVVFFDLVHEEPEAIAPLLEPFLKMKYAELVDSGAISVEAKKGAPSTILVQPDARSGRLMVAGPALLMPEAEALIKQFDAPGEGERVTRVVQLDKSDPEEMAQTIRAMLTGQTPAPTRPGREDGRRRRPQRTPSTSADSVMVIPAPGGTALVLAGYTRDVEEVEGWIKMLDGGAGELWITKVYKFSRTDVESFADTIMTLVDSGGGAKAGKKKEDDWSMSYGGPRRGKDVSLVTDPYGGTMLVKASPMKMREIDELYAMHEGTEEEEGILRRPDRGPVLMYELQYADAFDAVYNAEALFEAVLGEEDAPSVDYIPFTNILVIRGKPDQFAQVEELLGKYIDKESEAEKGVVLRVFPVAGMNMTAEQLALLTKMRMPNIPVLIESMQADAIDYEGVGLVERVTPLSKPVVDADTNGRSTGSRCVLPASLLTTVDTTVAAALAQAGPGGDAEDAEDEETPDKQNVFRSVVGEAVPTPQTEAKQKDKAEREEKPQGIKIRYDNKSGVVVFEGRSKDIADLEYLLTKIKDEMKDLPVKPDIRVYRVKHVDVRVAAQVLESMFGAGRAAVQQQQAAARAAARQAQQQKQKAQKDQEADKEKRAKAGQPEQGQQPAVPVASTGGVRIFPDTRTRTLIIRAATEDFPAIVELLATIDKPGGRATDFKIIELKKLNAAEVEAMLKELLGIGTRTARAPRTPAPGANPAAAAAAAAQMQAQLKQFEMAGEGGTAINIAEEVKIASYPATNTLMVMGPRQAITLVEEFVEKLEGQEVPRRDVRTYVLEFADATSVAPQLEKLYKTTASRGRGDTQGGGFNPLEINAPTIVVEARRNALIVNALTIDFPKIEPLIEELDKPSDDEGEKVMEFPLQFADAVKLAKTLNNIYGDQSRRGKQPSTKKVSIIGDAETNTIFVRAPQELRDEITERIENAEAKAQAEAKPKVYKLAEAVPSAMAQKLAEAFGQDRRGRGKIKFTGDDTTKQLFVLAPKEIMPEIESLIALLDQRTDDIGIKVFKLKHARAPEVLKQMESMVKQMLGQIRGQGSVKLDVFSASADARSNSLIVMGGNTTFRLVQEVLDTVDMPAAAPIAVETMVYALQRAQAAEIARTINNLFRDRKDGIDPPRAEANVSTNTVLVRGTRDQHVEIKTQVIDKLDEYAAAPAVALLEKVIQLEHMKADDAATTLAQWFGDRQRAYKSANVQNMNPAELTVSVTPLVQSNQLVVMASEANIKRIEERLVDLDKEGVGTMSARITDVYAMQYVDPGQAAAAINNAFRTQGKVAERDQVSTSVVGTTQSVVVTASEENHGKIKELLAQLDVDTSAVARQNRLIQLKEANSDEIAQKLTTLFRQTMTTRRGDKPVQIISEPKTNSLLVYANDQELAQIQELVASIDVEPTIATQRLMQVYSLKYADPNGIVNAINQTYRARGRVSPQDEVTAVAEWGTQSVIISASESNHEKVAGLIQQIDVESTMTRETRVVKLENGNAEDIARTLGSAYRGRRTTRRGVQPVTITADKGTNSLIVYASDQELTEIAPLIKALDVEPDTERFRVFKTFKLTYGESWGVVNMINQIFRGVSRNPRDEVTASADWGSNAVLVAASPENMKRVEEIITEVDQKDAAQRTVRAIEIQHADASGVNRALNEMFRTRGQRGQQTVSISHVQGTNTVLIKANETEFEEIQSVLGQLDTAEAALGDIRTFPLQYTDATEMKEILETYLQRPGSGRGRGGGQLAGNVRISTSGLANALIISGDKEQVDALAEVIAKIDVEVTDAGTAPKILTLKFAMPSVVEPTLSKMFVDASKSRGRGSSAASMVPVIVADDASKSLIVRANPVDFTQIKDLVEMLDTEDAAGESGIKIIQLAAGVDVEDMAEQIQSLMDDSAKFEAEQRGKGAKPARVAIRADRRTNSLLVAGARSRFTEVEDLVRKLEKMGPRGGNVVVIMQPKNLNPDDVKRVVEQLTEDSSSSKGSRRSSSGRRRR